MSYLIKVTIVWTLFLLIYEVLYKHSGRFLWNRIYLLFSLVAGIILPLFSVPVNIGERPAVTYVYRITNQQLTTGNIIEEGTHSSAVDWSAVLLWIYVLVAIILLLLSLRDAVKVLKQAIYGRYEMKSGRKLFEIQHAAAPYSFMGWIFLSRKMNYSNDELDYIIRHEAAHNSRKHWIDVLLMQFACIVFWFHPLVWRYRYLLKTQHEYEADFLASQGNSYEYGHFLLSQTLLKDVPSIAHSFHFSPIKSRIAMLTQNQKAGFKKYLLVVPALALSMLVMAKTTDSNERKRVGNKTTYKGNVFEWSPNVVDTVVVVDPTTNKEATVVTKKNSEIIKMNGEDVKQEQADGMVNSRFNSPSTTFGEYVRKQLEEAGIQIPSRIAKVGISNLVIDKKGKIVYYDLNYVDTLTSAADPVYLYDPVMTPAIEKIISDSPNWLPALYNGNACNVFVGFKGANALLYKNVSMHGRKPDTKPRK